MFVYFFAGSVLDNGHSYTSGRHASLMTSGSRGAIQEATQLREGLLTGTLTGQKVNYLDSGYSEEDPNEQVTSCLMKTSSGSIYIPPSEYIHIFESLTLNQSFNSLMEVLHLVGAIIESSITSLKELYQFFFNSLQICQRILQWTRDKNIVSATHPPRQVIVQPKRA